MVCYMCAARLNMAKADATDPCNTLISSYSQPMEIQKVNCK